MTDPDEPFGWDMHQKPADEFFTGDCDLFPLSLVFVIFSSKGNRAVRHTFNTVVADRDPVGILPEIFDNGFGAIKRFLAVRDPLFFITGVQQFLKRIVVFEALRAAVEFKLSVFPKVLQLRKILATEKARNDPDGEKEIFPVVFPMVLGIKTTAKDNGMDVGMEVHFTPPGMENADIPDVCTEIFAVGSQFPQCIGRCVIQSIIQKLLIAVDDWIQFLRNSEDYMEVWRFQYIFPTGVHPLFLGELLAHGTTPVAAGIIVDGNTAALFTHTNVDAKSTCFAVPDVISCFSLSRGEFMSFRVLRIKAIEHILNCTGGAHASPPLCRS